MSRVTGYRIFLPIQRLVLVRFLVHKKEKIFTVFALRSLILVLVFCLACSSASAEKRALVVGIDNYDHLPLLQKAVGDARAMAKTFRTRGYGVVLLEDVGREAFWREWAKLLKQIKTGDEVAFVFSGHGLEIDGSNYLLTKDAPLATQGERVVRENALKVGSLLSELREKKPRVTLAILDACRNNPYATRGSKSIGSARGLARLEPPEGTFVMYSAGAGEEALDRLSDTDQETASVYTRILLPLLDKPGLRIQDVALQVREVVRAIAAKVPHRQNPAYYDELRGSFCFAGCAVDPQATSTAPKTPEPCASDNPQLNCLWRK